LAKRNVCRKYTVFVYSREKITHTNKAMAKINITKCQKQGRVKFSLRIADNYTERFHSPLVLCMLSVE